MKKIFDCAVNGILKKGNPALICGDKIVGNKKCGAHGNRKCEHKKQRPNNDE